MENYKIVDAKGIIRRSKCYAEQLFSLKSIQTTENWGIIKLKNMKHCKWFIIIAFIFNGAFSIAQSVDTTAINLLCKLKVFLEVQKEIKNINTELLNKYLSSDINVKYLHSNIYWIKFIEINIPTFSDNNIEPINECKRFVIAITETRDKTYRLLNFKNNDVREF